MRKQKLLLFPWLHRILRKTFKTGLELVEYKNVYTVSSVKTLHYCCFYCVLPLLVDTLLWSHKSVWFHQSEDSESGKRAQRWPPTPMNHYEYCHWISLPTFSNYLHICNNFEVYYIPHFLWNIYSVALHHYTVLIWLGHNAWWYTKCIAS